VNRRQLEHLIRAAGAITGSTRIIVIGSQAVLGALPAAHTELLVSMEADMWPEDAPEKADLIDGTIGEMSPFHDTFGYFAHGAGPETATLPSAWRQRLVDVTNVNTAGVTGLCLSPVDIFVSKAAAARPKDIAFVNAMLRHGVVRRAELELVLGELGDDTAQRIRRLVD
jgi:hypothetical protein